ncbi:universal stress protein [Rhodocaloribacter sp.]
MMKIRTILFPTDFSMCAEGAFTQAAYLAARFDAELHVLHVIASDALDADSPLSYFPLTEEEVAEQLHLSVGKRLEAAIAARRDEEARVRSAYVQNPSAADGILAYAEAHDVDLIVMGTHGRRGIKRLLMGSVAETVVRSATCPVLTVRGVKDPMRKPEVHRILAPIDFSKHSYLALAYAKDLAATYGAHLDLLHVIEETALPQVYSVEPPLVAVPEVRARAREALEALAREGAEVGVPTDVFVTVGYPVHEILDFAETRGHDLIVIATHGLTGVKHLLLGSVTEKVIRMALCPVFTVRSFGKMLLSEKDQAEALAALAPEVSATRA